MKYEWMDDYFLSKQGTERDFKVEWNAVRYQIGGKMYAMQGGDREGRPIITLKLEPQHGALLREQYADIVPGYYMNKEHWNSLYLEGSVPDDVLRGMIDEAHRLVLASLPKRVQREIEALS